MTSNTYTVQVKLSDNIAPPFVPVHFAIKLNKYNSYWLKGGRGSTKSSFAAIQIILGIIKDPKANGLVVRKVGDTIRTSVFETLLWAIDKLDLNAVFYSTVSPPQIIYRPTGQKILMKGLDDPLKLKSIKVKNGYFKFLWFEEAAEFNGMEEIRNVEQSVMRGGDNYCEFITYNPPNDPAAWVNKECAMPADDRLVHESCYLDVPAAWLGKKFLDDAERLRINDPLKYEHEYMGKAVGRAEQIIFHGKWKELDFSTPSLGEIYQSRFFYGVDWGFANDPTVMTRSFIRQERGEQNLYIEYEAVGHGVEMDELPALFDSIVDSRRWHIYADCSRPETISHVRQKRFNIDGAPKWSGSVEDGIEYLRSFNHIYIHPRCVHTMEEFRKYSYKVDKHTQEILPIIVDDWNHCIDSLRYGLADYIQKNVSILDVTD